METRTKLVSLELIASLFGWVWIGASVATLYFLVMALFSDGAWSSAFWSIGIGVVAKWLAKGFRDNQIRVAFVAEMVAKGHSPQEANEVWLSRYNRDGKV
jgi:hypothetical protein